MFEHIKRRAAQHQLPKPAVAESAHDYDGNIIITGCFHDLFGRISLQLDKIGLYAMVPDISRCFFRHNP